MKLKVADYISKVLSKCEDGTELIDEYINAVTPIRLKCKAGHIRYATTNGILSRGTGTKCKECSGTSASGKKLQSTVDAEFSKAGYTIIGEYQGALTKVLAKNNTCGHTYLVLPSAVSRGRTVLCPTCHSRRSNYTHEDFVQELVPVGLIPVGTYTGMKNNISVINTKCNHEYSVNPGHLLYDGIGVHCAVCSGLGSSIKTRFLSKLADNNIELEDEYTTVNASIIVKNNNCGHRYNVIPNNVAQADSGLICRICTPTQQVSKGEVEILEFIKHKYNGWIETSDRTLLDGKELDIVIPDLGIAIEYNGVFWHSEEKLGANYHLDKTKKANSMGFRLIHIYDYEWSTKRDIVKSRLSTILGLNNSKIYARRTEVKRIPFPAEFLNRNHIQGAGTPTKVNFGLFLGDELISVMTFAKPRFDLNHDYELVRFCNKLNTSVVGGASKLLKAFRSNYSGSIVSYSDLRWSTGNLYKVLGFTHIRDSQPNYRYFKYKYSLSRYQCTKQNLKTMFPDIWEETKSEYQIMTEAGYHKVHDCGSGVWSLK